MRKLAQAEQELVNKLNASQPSPEEVRRFYRMEPLKQPGCEKCAQSRPGHRCDIHQKGYR